jgi:hypothetical protein
MFEYQLSRTCDLTGPTIRVREPIRGRALTQRAMRVASLQRFRPLAIMQASYGRTTEASFHTRRV